MPYIGVIKVVAFQLLLAGFSLSSIKSEAFADSKTDRLAELVQAIVRVQRDAYGSIHAVFTQRTDDAGVVSLVEVEFWSRENKFFRVDIHGKSGTNAKKTMSRLIVRPEGFFRLKASSEDNLAIAGYGTSLEGMEQLYSESFFRAGETLGFGPKLEAISTELSQKSPQSSWEIISIQPVPPDIEEITFGLKEYTWQVRIRSPLTAIFSVSVNKASTKDAVNRTTREFSPDGVLKKSVCRVERSNGSILKEEITLDFVKQVENPMGLFSIEAQGVSQGNIWVRRLLILSAGLALLGIYFAYRRVQNRA
jgi:hypothetical protein